MIGTFGLAAVQAKINVDSSRDAARAMSKTDQLKTTLRMLQANLQKAMMINEALWELIRENHGLTENDLHAKIYEIDMRDGTLDGKNQRKAQQCPECKRMVSPRHPACIYCGHIIDDSVFVVS